MKIPGAVIGLVVVALHAPVAWAQGNVATLLAGARAHLEQFNPDSAAALLEKALAPASGATKAERVRAYVLYGIAQLTLKNMTGARQAFRNALQANPNERVDSLEFLEPENLLREFNSERLAVVPAAREAPVVVAPAPVAVVAALTVEVTLPADTTMPVATGRFPIRATPSRQAMTEVTIAPAATPLAVVWSDTLAAGATGVMHWNLRGNDGALVPPGRYAVTVTAMDSAGELSEAEGRVLVVSRAAPDTQALPPALAPSAFLPETAHVAHRSPAGLLVGAGLGVAVAVLPSALGRTELNQGQGTDGTAYVVAGSVSLAGLVGFLVGTRTHTPLPENARRNADLRQRDAESRAAIASANARAREAAPVRVQVEGGAP